MTTLHKLEQAIIVPHDIDRVFQFFNRPENLEKITPPHLNFKILTPGPVDMFNGQVIDYSISLYGFPMRWTSLITNYNPPFSFVDTQLKGPYSFWYHEHRFEALSDHKTRIIDHVSYVCPYGIIGEWGHFWVKKSLDKIFRYRSSVIINQDHSFF